LGIVLAFNTGTEALLRIDLNSKDVTEVTINGDFNGGGDGMLLSSDGTLYAVTGGTHIFAFSSDDDWVTANVVGAVDVSSDGETAATITFGNTEDEIYVTHVRFGDLFGAGPNEEPSLVSKVILAEGIVTNSPMSVPVALPTLQPGISSPPQATTGSPTLPPQSLTSPPQAGTPGLPTLPPQSLSSPPQASTPGLPTLPPQSLSSPPQASTPDVPTLPPQTNGLPTLPPQTNGLPTSPPQNEMNVLFYDFEDGAFPVSPWTTGGDGVWAVDQTQVNAGIYSIKSPDLESIYNGTGLTSNATLTLDDSFSGGVLNMRVYAR
jgi:hypothetical protein